MNKQPDEQSVRQQFAHQAIQYAAHQAIPREIAQRVLSRLDYMRLSPAAILDLSLYPANSDSLIRQQYKKARYVAMAPVIDFLQQRKKHWFQRRQSVCGFGAQLAFRSRSFDFIFINLTLSWVADWPALLRECRRVLKPGGMILFSSLGPDTLKELSIAQSIQPHLTDMHDIGDACIQAGFENPVMDVSSLVIDYATPQACLAECTALNLISPVIKQIDAQQVTFEMVVGHAWAGDRLPQQQHGGEIGVSIDNIRPSS
jgi:malonyl-CoA O-methyltransferase